MSEENTTVGEEFVARFFLLALDLNPSPVLFDSFEWVLSLCSQSTFLNFTVPHYRFSLTTLLSPAQICLFAVCWLFVCFMFFHLVFISVCARSGANTMQHSHVEVEAKVTKKVKKMMMKMEEREREKKRQRERKNARLQ